MSHYYEAHGLQHCLHTPLCGKKWLGSYPAVGSRTLISIAAVYQGIAEQAPMSYLVPSLFLSRMSNPSLLPIQL